MTAVRFALLLSAIFVVILVAAGLIFRDELAKQVREDIDEGLADYAHSLAEEIDTSGGIPGWLIGQDIEYFIGQSEAYRLENGIVFGPIRGDAFEKTGFQTLSERDLFSPKYFQFLRDDFLSEYELDIDDAAGIRPDDFRSPDRWRVLVTDTGNGRLMVYTPIAEVEDALALIPTLLWPIGLAIIAATLLSGLVLGFCQQRRITKINDALDRIADGDLAYRIAPIKVRDDMDAIARRVDQSAERLDGSIRQMREFSQNIAHELKTPLARLRATLETAKGEEQIEHALMQTDDVIRIFDAIQRISRMNNKGIATNFGPVDLAELSRMIFDLYADVAEESGQRIVTDIQQPGTVTGDQQLLAQMLSNLIENALRYAGPNATITLRAAPNTLIVQDNGPGLPVDQRNKMFDAFFTADQSASRQGSGLGLALVKAIAGFHSAEINANDAPNGGLLIEVKFPEG